MKMVIKIFAIFIIVGLLFSCNRREKCKFEIDEYVYWKVDSVPAQITAATYRKNKGCIYTIRTADSRRDIVVKDKDLLKK